VTTGGRQIAFGHKAATPTGRARQADHARVVGDQDAAKVALDASVQDPTDRRARTPAEQRLIADLISRGATVTFPPDNAIPTVRGGMPPTLDEILHMVPGRLEFILQWNRDADLDLILGTPAGKGELLAPIRGFNRVASGGTIPFDHLGGPHGGFEVAFWRNQFPSGDYGIEVDHVSGGMTDFTVNVYADGQPVPILNTATDSAQNSLTGKISQGAAGGIASPTSSRAAPGPRETDSPRGPAPAELRNPRSR